jgi:(p)ppGpp synthase/HD superfamily hydrolase
VSVLPVLADMDWVNVDVYAVAKRNNLKLTIKALKEAKRFHQGLMRADGREAFVHPHKVCQILMFYFILHNLLNNVNLSIISLWEVDVILAAALLHDVLEDVKDKTAAMKRISKKFPEEVTSLVVILTKGKNISVTEYCQHIGNKIGAVLVKLADRLHNLRNMIRRLGQTDFFTEERLRRQIEETNMCVLKLAYWVSAYEEKFQNKKHNKFLDMAQEMTIELKKTIHLAQVALAELSI